MDNKPIRWFKGEARKAVVELAYGMPCDVATVCYPCVGALSPADAEVQLEQRRTLIVEAPEMAECLEKLYANATAAMRGDNQPHRSLDVLAQARGLLKRLGKWPGVTP